MADAAPIELTPEQIERRLLTKRKFARTSFGVIIALTIILLGFGLSSDHWANRIESMMGVLGMTYATFGGIIASYMGASAWMTISKK